MSTHLSVNINKWATLRNARGTNRPDLLQTAKDIQDFGAAGITVHPRPDERHIKYRDARDLKKVVTTEYNIEGNPINRFIDLVLEIKPTQVTLVPDEPDALTSDSGWDTISHQDFLKKTIRIFKAEGIRCSIFLNPDIEMVKAAADTGTDRIELYTEPYAAQYAKDPTEAIASFISASAEVNKLGLGLNAGHDLSLDNIAFFAASIPSLKEVSIGHALICESIYMGLENVIQMYNHKLKNY
ncbi:MAG: pyridoxine 5'-phosphate synthase [Flavobacteriaceae bacterium]|nr:pyridoxine 5'-phosphate synthase [Flavobacteriaceae bacterium]OUX39253.1 MAG: pyridoxine 5'-phosphate synthase [Flavobacteriaceae bacterium TMED265]